MDRLLLGLKTKFGQRIVSKLISRIIKKKTGYYVDFQINDLNFSILDGETHLHVNLDARMSDKEFDKILKQTGLI